MNRAKAFLEARTRARQRAQEASPAVVAAEVARAKREAPAEPQVRPRPRNAAAAFLAKAAKRENPAAYAEVHRIVEIPYLERYSDEEREGIQRELVMGHHYERGFRLHGLQCDAILAFRETGNLFGPIGVGWGKTLITLLIAAEAYRAGIARTLQIVPPQVMQQLVRHDIPWARERVVLSGTPFIPVDGSANKRFAIATSGRRGCYILPSSMLSTSNAEDVLEAIHPEVIVGDEAHHFRHAKSARTRRLMKFIDAHQPHLVWLSGTITSKSVMDYWHLVRYFQNYCPLPRKPGLASTWGAILDSDSEYSEGRTGPISPLIEWAIERPEVPDTPFSAAGFRRAYKHRLISNPCVVASGDQELGTSLTIRHQKVEPDEDTKEGKKLRELQSAVTNDWIAPTGDEIDHAFHTFRWLFELSAGFYNDLFWPEPEVLAKRRGITEFDAECLLDLAKEHHEKEQEYRKVLRSWLQRHHVRGLDTPFLVGGDMARHGARNVGQDLYKAWNDAHLMKTEHPDMPDRDSRVVRICDYKIQHAKSWAEEHGHGIIWYHNKGIGDWLAEEIEQAVHCPAGKASNVLLSSPEGTRGKIVIASIEAHGTGKNLQFHQNQLYAQWPRPAKDAEQSLGRLHRVGQEADELFADIISDFGGSGEPATFDELNYAATLRDALYIHQTTGNRQKLIYAQYDPLPRVFPQSVLEERGFEMKMRLSKEQEEELSQKFSVDY